MRDKIRLRGKIRLVVAAALVLGAGLVVAAPVSAGPKFRLTSSAFEAGADIPVQFSCDGDDTSPPLKWKGAPKRAVELALVLEDPDAPGEVFFHWVLWGIDPAAKTLVEGTLPPDAVEGANSTGQTGYMGPCPPPGDTHRYRFVVYALSKPVTLDAGATAAELRAAIRKSTLAKATLVARFGH